MWSTMTGRYGISFKLLLETHGMVVEDYASTEEFARGRVPGHKACLILDQHLPGTSGLDFLAAQDGALAELPIIMITGREIRRSACGPSNWACGHFSTNR